MMSDMAMVVIVARTKRTNARKMTIEPKRLRTMNGEQCATSFPIHVHFEIYFRARIQDHVTSFCRTSDKLCRLFFIRNDNECESLFDGFCYLSPCTRMCVLFRIRLIQYASIVSKAPEMCERERNSSFFIRLRNRSIQTSPTVSNE